MRATPFKPYTRMRFYLNSRKKGLNINIALPCNIVNIIVLQITNHDQIDIMSPSRRMNVYPGTLLRKLKPSFIETLKTGQVAETYTLAVQCCRKQLGIQKIFTQRLLPMGLVLYMPVSMIGMIAFVMYASINSGGMITPMWIIKAIVFALILLVAAPPIPGVNLLSYVVIIGQLEIGREYIIAAMIFDIIFSMFASAANQTLLQTDLILQADRMGLINRNTLTKGDE